MKTFLLFAMVLVAMAAAGCAGTSPAPGTSGIEVFGTIDASVGRTSNKP